MRVEREKKAKPMLHKSCTKMSTTTGRWAKGLTTAKCLAHLPVVVDIFVQLLWSIGLAFFALATVSITLQAWLADSNLAGKNNPYFLYAVSNLGSFGALVSYPFFFESFFTLREQFHFWKTGYVIFVFLQVLLFMCAPLKRSEVAEAKDRIPFSARETCRCLLFGAAGVMMFLAVTNILTSEIAPIPLLWMIPLCAYLLSFAFVFKRNPWYPSWIKKGISVFFALGIIIFLLIYRGRMSILLEVVFLNLILFFVCMFCQGELYSSRPKDNRQLTFFYAMIALGGFLGGILTSWVIPVIFDHLVEYFLAFVLIGLAMMTDYKADRVKSADIRIILYFLVLLILWPVAFANYHPVGLAAFCFVAIAVFQSWKSRPHVMNLALLCLIALMPALEMIWTKQVEVARLRNYYGIYKIHDHQDFRIFMHGTTIHGGQFLSKRRELHPTTYYAFLTPVGQIMKSGLFEKIGAVGLGVGVLSTYLKENQSIDFFEIDPDVYRLANKHFTFLKKSKGKVNVIFGDARLSLESNPQDRYDLIIVDAFSGDAIPVHLLTLEAINLYRRHLTKDGLILFHVSNRAVKLAPVLLNNAREAAAYIAAKANATAYDSFASNWMAMTWSALGYETLISKLEWRKPPSEDSTRMRPWSDEYSNLTAILKTKTIFDIKGILNPFSMRF